MRTYKAQSLEEYIRQLEEDLYVLKKYILNPYNAGSWEETVTNDFVTAHRDTWENHSDILGTHRDHLRQMRNWEKSIKDKKDET